MSVNRRNLLRFGALGLGAATAGCDQVGQSRIGSDALAFQNWLTYRVQRFLFPDDQLAPEFAESAISTDFRANGTTSPPDPDYKALAARNFVDWRLQVGGLVRNKLSLSLADIRAMPARTQITRHDCVEGWSCIGKWTGAPLSHVLDQAGVLENARFLVFYCGDSMDENSIVSTNAVGASGAKNAAADSADGEDDGDTAQTASGAPAPAAAPGADAKDQADDQDAADEGPADTHYYSSIDLVAARHPQTILAYEMNGKPLAIPYGAPLRLRNERQLGYKMPKYLMRIELVEKFSDIRGGKGGYWEDLGYDWFAGI